MDWKLQSSTAGTGKIFLPSRRPYQPYGPTEPPIRTDSISLNLQYDIAEAVTGVSIWRTWFYPMVDHVGAVADEVEFRQAFSHHLVVLF